MTPAEFAEWASVVAPLAFGAWIVLGLSYMMYKGMK